MAYLNAAQTCIVHTWTVEVLNTGCRLLVPSMSTFWFVRMLELRVARRSHTEEGLLLKRILDLSLARAILHPMIIRGPQTVRYVIFSTCVDL